MTWAMPERPRLLSGRWTIAAFALSAGLVGSGSALLVASASAEGNPSSSVLRFPSAMPSPDSEASSLLVVPLTETNQFPTTSPSNLACPASGGTSPPPGGGITTPPPGGTATPSVSPTVLGITFDTPPLPTTPSKPGGKLPFTGFPLTRLCLVASAVIGTGLILRRSKRRHQLSRR
jgi:hypothetical protein